MDGAAAPGGHHGRADLAGQGAAVGLGHHPGPIHESLHLRGDVRKIGRRAQKDGVRGQHLPEHPIEGILPEGATVVPPGHALEAGHAAVEVSASHLDQLGLPTGLRQGFQHRFKQQERVAVLLGTAIEGKGFHGALRSPQHRSEEASGVL